jgi:DNA end-binding protein Ku
MAAPRAFWKGHLRLSLVSIHVALISATERSASISLRQLHKPSGKRIRYEKVAPGIGPVDDADIVKGFELDTDGYVVLEPEELDAIKLESRRAIRLVQFVERGEIDPRYFDRPYYVVPEGDEAAEGYGVIRDALREADKSGLGQMTMRGREHLVAVRPCGRGLLLETLRYGAEVRAADSIFDDIPNLDVDEEMRGLAHELIERKTAPFDPDAFQDSYASALRELIERKREGDAVIGGEEKERRKGGEVVDLMAALRASVEEDKGRKGTRKGKAPRRSRKAS